uniref:Uncharacterized protein n=1 Tax=Rhizophora mucronata TaxID=61149 RepID=A0A2P2Q278_RHIMU
MVLCHFPSPTSFYP